MIQLDFLANFAITFYIFYFYLLNLYKFCYNNFFSPPPTRPLLGDSLTPLRNPVSATVSVDEQLGYQGIQDHSFVVTYICWPPHILVASAEGTSHVLINHYNGIVL